MNGDQGRGRLVLQLSDPHFGTEQPVVAEALQRLAAKLVPDLVVLSGDITQRATAAQFEAASRFTAGLNAPVLVVPGNHDIPLLNLGLRVLAPYARHRRAFGAELEPSFETPSCWCWASTPRGPGGTRTASFRGPGRTRGATPAPGRAGAGPPSSSPTSPWP
ncbi:MAG: metallophosphoesterase [Myxococcales bacterium]